MASQWKTSSVVTESAQRSFVFFRFSKFHRCCHPTA